MKKLLVIFLVLACIIMTQSCDTNDYSNSFVIRVTYMNGDVDTIDYNRVSFGDEDMVIELNIATGGLLSGAGTTPCIVSYNNSYGSEVVCCGVRKFSIISHDKMVKR